MEILLNNDIPTHISKSFPKERDFYKYLNSTIDDFDKKLNVNSVLVTLPFSDTDRFNFEECWKITEYIQNKFISMLLNDDNIIYGLSCIERYHKKDENKNKTTNYRKYVNVTMNDNEKRIEVVNNFIYRNIELNLDIEENESKVCLRITSFIGDKSVYYFYRDIPLNIIYKCYDKLLSLSEKFILEKTSIFNLKNYPHSHYVLFHKYPNTLENFEMLSLKFNSFNITRNKIDVGNLEKLYKNKDSLEKYKSVDAIAYILKDYNDVWLNSILKESHFKLYNLRKIKDIDVYYDKLMIQSNSQKYKIYFKKMYDILNITQDIKQTIIIKNDKIENNDNIENFQIYVFGNGNPIPSKMEITKKPSGIKPYTVNYYRAKILEHFEKNQYVFVSFRANNKVTIYKRDVNSSCNMVS